MTNGAEKYTESQKKITDKNIKDTNHKLTIYYGLCMSRVIAAFESTYDKLQATIADGREPTPADLYNLDKYWKMQGQLREELQKLGDKQIHLLSRKFESEFFDIYNSIEVESAKAYSTIDKAAAKQMINRIWCADGKNWSQRVWDNTSRLQNTLNDSLIECVLTGKTTSDLKLRLQEQFGVSYNRADSLVRTEMAHIHVEAARQRYEDYGIQEVEMWIDEDERTCPVCAALEGKKYPVGAELPLPAHPRCRCSIIPVVS